jgi:hypothetical protein
VPWCDECSRFWNPNSVPTDGCCPSCGATLPVPVGIAAARSTDTQEYKAPWHFWALVIAAVVYLGWRVVQMIGWLVA